MAENRNPGNTWVAGAGLGLLTVNSGLAIYRARGDPASILFVSASYAALLLLFACLRAYELAPPRSPLSGVPAVPAAVVWGLAIATTAGGFFALTMLLTLRFAWKVAAVMPSTVPAVVVWGLAIATTAGGFFALTTLLTAGFAWKDAVIMPSAALPAAAVWGQPIATTAGGFVALLLFVTVSYLALVHLLACLRACERALPGSPARRAAVWPLPTPLTAPRAGGGRPVSAERQVAAALTMVALGVMTCDTALAIHDALGDLCSATTLVLVGVAYAVYLALTFRFIRAFAGRAAH